jgi:hypothetical protein
MKLLSLEEYVHEIVLPMLRIGTKYCKLSYMYTFVSKLYNCNAQGKKKNELYNPHIIYIFWFLSSTAMIVPRVANKSKNIHREPT